MSYNRKSKMKITKFFDDGDYARVKKSCKRYQGLMAEVGMEKMELHWSSIQRFDAMCVVPTPISGSIASELGEEIDRDSPCMTQIGEVRITDAGNGKSRVQVPVFPM